MHFYIAFSIFFVDWFVLVLSDITQMADDVCASYFVLHSVCRLGLMFLSYLYAKVRFFADMCKHIALIDVNMLALIC